MLAIRNLTGNKLRTVLTILGISLAVLSIILLASIGNGLLTTGNKLMDQNPFHLWITGTASDIQSQYHSSEGSRITDSHIMVMDLKKNKDINNIAPLLTEMVYAFKENSEPRAIFAFGMEHMEGSMVTVTDGEPLGLDNHYNNGRYDGEMSNDVLIDSKTASLLKVKVGDTIHIGKTITEANTQKFNIIGQTDSLSKFSSNPMVIFYLSELQEITGNKYYDSVNMIILRLRYPEKAYKVQRELQEKYPYYTVTSNQEYLIKALKQNSLPLASAASIVVLAVVMGTMLAVNTMLLSFNEKKKEIAILRVIGLSRWSIFKNIGTEGLLISLAGGALALLISEPLIKILNDLIYTLIGFKGLVIMQTEYLYIGLFISVCIGLITSVLAALRISRINTDELLRST